MPPYRFNHFHPNILPYNSSRCIKYIPYIWLVHANPDSWLSECIIINMHLFVGGINLYPMGSNRTQKTDNFANCLLLGSPHYPIQCIAYVPLYCSIIPLYLIKTHYITIFSGQIPILQLEIPILSLHPKFF